MFDNARSAGKASNGTFWVGQKKFFIRQKGCTEWRGCAWDVKLGMEWGGSRENWVREGVRKVGVHGSLRRSRQVPANPTRRSVHLSSLSKVARMLIDDDKLSAPPLHRWSPGHLAMSLYGFVMADVKDQARSKKSTNAHARA